MNNILVLLISSNWREIIIWEPNKGVFIKPSDKHTFFYSLIQEGNAAIIEKKYITGLSLMFLCNTFHVSLKIFFYVIFYFILFIYFIFTKYCDCFTFYRENVHIFTVILRLFLMGNGEKCHKRQHKKTLAYKSLWPITHHWVTNLCSRCHCMNLCLSQTD